MCKKHFCCCRSSICFSILADFLVNLHSDNVLIQQQIDDNNNDNNYQRSAVRHADKRAT